MTAPVIGSVVLALPVINGAITIGDCVPTVGGDDGVAFSGVWAIHVDSVQMVGGTYGGGDQDDSFVIP